MPTTTIAGDLALQNTIIEGDGPPAVTDVADDTPDPQPKEQTKPNKKLVAQVSAVPTAAAAGQRTRQLRLNPQVRSLEFVHLSCKCTEGR